MAQVICTSKHAIRAKYLGGVLFYDSPAGRISQDISDDKAAEFLSTPEHFKPYFGDPVPTPKIFAADAAAAASSQNAKVTDDPAALHARIAELEAQAAEGRQAPAVGAQRRGPLVPDLPQY